MTTSLLSDAFDHHVWATLRVIDTCLALSPGQLATAVPGTFGTILDTLRHIVGADTAYLYVMTGERWPLIEEDDMDLPQLRAAMEANGAEWTRLLATNPDPGTILSRHREDGSATHAPFGIRLAQALHHGSDHRSQICTALTLLDIAPPDIDVWDFGWQNGQVVEVAPTE